MEDYEIGISAWKNYLVEMSYTPKITKAKLQKVLDGLLWKISEIEIGFGERNRALKITHPNISFIEVEHSRVISMAFEDDWIFEYFCMHCQGYGCVRKYLYSMLYLDNVERIDQIMELLRKNPYLKVSPETILEKARDDLIYTVCRLCYGNLLLNVTKNLDQYPNFLPEINYLFRVFFQGRKEEALCYWHRICELCEKKGTHPEVPLNTDRIVAALNFDADLDVAVYRSRYWFLEYVIRYSENVELLCSIIANISKFNTKYKPTQFLQDCIRSNNSLSQERKQQLFASIV